MGLTGARNILVKHWVFLLAMLTGLALRVITMLGFPPAIWFGGDSASYLSSSLTWYPGTSRESGYSVFLAALRPFHNFAVVTGVQHLAGLATAVLIYALLRHRYRLPGWGATLAAAPVLLDSYVIQLEQEILVDAMFTWLVTVAVVLVLWWPDRERPRWSAPAAALLLGVAASLWPVGLPLLIVLGVFMLIRRFGWRTIVITTVAGALPLAAYAAWYDVRYHQVAFSSSSGVFLWSRTTTFANCEIIRPPADLRPLCPAGPPSARHSAPSYIWAHSSPLLAVGGAGTDRFTVTRNQLAGEFARRAIEAQPLAYAGTVARSWLLTFDWNRPGVPSPEMASRYQFTNATQSQNAMGGGTAADVAAGEAALHQLQRQYTGGHTADTAAVQPFARIMIDYQKAMYLRGTMLGVLMLIGLGGIVRSWSGGSLRPRRDRPVPVEPAQSRRRRDWGPEVAPAQSRRRRDWGAGAARVAPPALFPWLTALIMEIAPVATADFSLRYVVPTIPITCLAAALAFARPLRTPQTGPGLAPPGSERLTPALSPPGPGEWPEQAGNTTS